MIIPMPCGGNIDIELKELRPDSEMSCSKGCVHEFKEINAAAAEVLSKRRAKFSLEKLINPRILLSPTFWLCIATLIIGFVEI
ncbi:MAG: hypothetical protein Q7R35_01855, partial [Elusimicrobiota bacterium]|nr:hypothetical protein [Elusimicrobiota bacterium]